MPVLAASRLVDCARAVALHVDGAYRDAALRWAAVAETGPRAWDAKLREATAWLCLDEPGPGLAALADAAALGAPSRALLEARAQYAARRRDWRAAETLLRDALDEHAGDGELRTALGVALRRQGRTEEARSCFERALDAPRADALAGVNLVALDVAGGPARLDGRAEALLSRAAAEHPHRPEPHVLLSRLARGAGDGETTRLALARARIRARRLGTLTDAALARWAADDERDRRESDRVALRALARVVPDAALDGALDRVRSGEIRAGYDFFAVLSWARAASLTWLENQRVHVAASLTLAATSTGGTLRVASGVVVPEAPVEVTILRGGRTVRRLRVPLALGFATVRPGVPHDAAEVRLP
jgi:Flp pilus assembly protein TadD